MHTELLAQMLRNGDLGNEGVKVSLVDLRAVAEKPMYWMREKLEAYSIREIRPGDDCVYFRKLELGDRPLDAIENGLYLHQLKKRKNDGERMNATEYRQLGAC